MVNTNYISVIAKILEKPEQQIRKNDILVTKFRVQIPQFQGVKVVTLTCWGDFARDMTASYTANDYLVVEGYLSIRKKNLESKTQSIEMTVLRSYPYFLIYN